MPVTMNLDLDENRVKEYLKSNQDFSKTWFVQNAPKEFVQEWFQQRREPVMKKHSHKFFNQDSIKNGNDVFLSVTNLLSDESKSHMQEEQLTASYAKIAKDGRNSITLELFNDILERGASKNKSSEQLTREQLKEKFNGMNEHELFMELISDVTNELDMDTLCHKILVNVSILTNSDRSSLFLAKGSRDKRYLVAKLFDVTPDCPLQQALMSAEQHQKIPPLPFGTGIIGHVALSKQNVNIENAYEVLKSILALANVIVSWKDLRFNKDIDARTGYHTKSLMCQPIVNFGGDVIGVAECINKLTEDSNFTRQDEEVFQKYLTFCGIGIQNAQLFELSVLEYKRNKLLLTLAKTIFEDTSSLDVLINKIMGKAMGILNCDKCRVYLVSNNFTSESDNDIHDIFKTMYELEKENNEVNKIEFNELNKENLYLEYARQVALSEKTLNFTNYLNREAEGFADSILSVPIQNNLKKVIGVAQLVKTEKDIFTEVDIATLEAFSIFCGLGIYNCLMYERAIKLNARQEVALEVLAYHASATLEETNDLMNTPVPSAEVYNLHSFQFDDLLLSDKETCQVTLRIFIELDFLNDFKIPYDVLCRWILSIRKNYRQVLYHNWRHALNVTQTMFIMLTTYGLSEVMTRNEQLALIMATLCHDLDHRGTNNSFQTKIGSPLAILYSSSIMENHHFYHCQLILKAEGNNILKSLSSSDYQEVIKTIENCILSTDLEQYFKKKDKFAELVKSGEKDWTDPYKKDLLRAMLMTSCDLSAICKPWRIQKRVAELVASEFFEQGDLEKSMQQEPIAMMDRNRKDELPSMSISRRQVKFIDHICNPLYKLLYEFWPSLQPFYRGCLENREKWQTLVTTK